MTLQHLSIQSGAPSANHNPNHNPKMSFGVLHKNECAFLVLLLRAPYKPNLHYIKLAALLCVRHVPNCSAAESEEMRRRSDTSNIGRRKEKTGSCFGGCMLVVGISLTIVFVARRSGSFRAVFVIASGSDGRAGGWAETLLEPAK